MSFLSAEDAPKTFGRKPLSTQKAINQALAILHEFGLNVSALPARRRERLAMTLLALADVAFPDSWH